MTRPDQQQALIEFLDRLAPEERQRRYRITAPGTPEGRVRWTVSHAVHYAVQARVDRCNERLKEDECPDYQAR